MNLLCPSCQKPLTVPEQFAGQQMKCPLCEGTFLVPALPGATPPGPGPAPAAAPKADVYDLTPMPPTPEVAPPKPERTSPRPAPEPPRTPPADQRPEPAAKPQAPPAGYDHGYTVWVSPRVVQ